MTASPEIWKAVPEYDGYYEISNYGRFAAIRNNERFIRKINLATYYPTVSFRKRPEDACQKSRTVHSLVAELFIGQRPEGHVIRHLDGDRYNSKVENLVYGTVEQNINEAILHKSHKGRNNGRALLCEKGAEAVRMLIELGISQSSIARRLDVSIGTINAIKTGRNWS